MDWSERGVYFFFEEGELRQESGTGQRVIRVGTHALKAGSKTTLWKRLSQHRGVEKTGGGNHRGSVFRKHVGAALLRRDGNLNCLTWGEGSSAPRSVRNAEHDLERKVSERIGAMPFLWLPMNDAPGPESMRGYVERNSIALLSNYDKPTLDESSEHWLGRDCPSERLSGSGLWNSNHVDESYGPEYLTRLDEMVMAVETNT